MYSRTIHVQERYFNNLIAHLLLMTAFLDAFSDLPTVTASTICDKTSVHLTRPQVLVCHACMCTRSAIIDPHRNSFLYLGGNESTLSETEYRYVPYRSKSSIHRPYSIVPLYVRKKEGGALRVCVAMLPSAVFHVASFAILINEQSPLVCVMSRRVEARAKHC